MATPQHQGRDEVWYSIWDAQTLTRYYQTISRRNALWGKAANNLLIMVGIATVVSATTQGSGYVTTGAAATVTVISLWIHLAEYAKKAAIAYTVADKCGELDRELNQLLRDIDRNRLTEEQAEDEYRRLRTKLDHATTQRDGVIVTSPKKYNKIADETKQQMEAQHAH